MKLEDLKPTLVYDTYWNFATKRQEVFFNRMKNSNSHWSDDEIIQKFKFTNAYRASDRVSQFLIKNIIYCENTYSPEDICFRILFFKLFNRIETWKYIEHNLGEISYSSYSYDTYNSLLTSRLNGGEKIYSAAYIMPSGKKSFGFDKKHQNNLRLLEYMMESGLPKEIAKSKNLKDIYNVLISYPTLGSFLAFQYTIDINYSELCDYSEMSFVVAGPGAKNGIEKCFAGIGRYKYEDIIRFVAESQEIEFEQRNLPFQSLFGRKLQLIDCQNLFCETDKYSRIAHPDIVGGNGRKRIKQQYISRYSEEIKYFYPPKWGINDKINT